MPRAVPAALATVAAGEPDIIVELAAPEFIDSSGVAALAHGRSTPGAPGATCCSPRLDRVCCGS